MANLDGKTPALTFKSILNVGTLDNQELDTTLRVVEDGKGNDSNLELATNKVKVITTLGVGTDPSYPLDVYGTNTVSSSFVNNQDTNSITFRDQDTTSDTHVGIGAQDNDFFIRAGNAEKFRINSDGEVGIGTNNPQYDLDVVGEIALDTNLHFGGAGTHYIKHDGGTASSDNFTFRFSDNEDAMIVRGDGKIGIGDLVPNQILGIKGTNAQISIEESDTEFLRLGIGETEGDHIIGFDDGGKLIIGCYDSPTDTSISTKLTILNNGNVGIGTATPSSPLEINTDDGTALTIIDSNAGSGAGPNIQFYRNSSSPADDDLLGLLLFNGRNDNSQDVIYSSIYAMIADASDGTESSTIFGKIKKSGADKTAFRFAHDLATFNSDLADINFKVSSADNANCLFLDAGNNNVGVGATPDSAVTFDVTRTTAGYSQRIYNSSTAGSSHGLFIKAGKDEEHASNPLFIENQAGDDLLKVTAKGTLSIGGQDNSEEYTIYAKARTGVDSRMLIDGSGNTADSNISFQNRHGNRYSWIQGRDEGTSNSGLAFGTGSAGTPAERMTINKDGEVGINNTNPAYTLDVSGNINATGNITNASWNGDVIASAYLDTDTAHLTGAQTFSGAKTFDDNIFIKESASADADVAGDGQLWIKNDTPNNLYFTNDAGNDVQITNGTSIAASPCYWQQSLGGYKTNLTSTTLYYTYYRTLEDNWSNTVSTTACTYLDSIAGFMIASRAGKITNIKIQGTALSALDPFKFYIYKKTLQNNTSNYALTLMFATSSITAPATSKTWSHTEDFSSDNTFAEDDQMYCLLKQDSNTGASSLYFHININGEYT